MAQELTAAIPSAQLAVLPGDAASPFSGDVKAGVDAIAQFVGLAPPRDAAAAPAGLPSEQLTRREAEILALRARGRANKEIASALGLSVHTVEGHLTNLYAKIGCRSRSEATAYAFRSGFAWRYYEVSAKRPARFPRRRSTIQPLRLRHRVARRGVGPCACSLQARVASSGRPCASG